MQTTATDKEEKPRSPLVLASSSLQRVELLEQMGLAPAHIQPSSLDETPRFWERPRSLSWRLAAEKARYVDGVIRSNPALKNAFIVAADTVVSVRQRVLFKPTTRAEALRCLQLLSGRTHRVFTSVAVLTPSAKIFEKLVETKVKFIPITAHMAAEYLDSNEWYGRAGGYAIQGLAGAFVSHLSGSFSAVVGLPLMETKQLLTKAGFFTD